MDKFKITLLFTSLVIGGWLTAVHASEPEAAKSEKLCVGLTQIDGIDIIDKQNIVFRMNNGGYYLNRLPNSCSTLYRDKAIMYKTSLSELCNVDIITVLDSIGGGYEPAGACGLGKFKPISKAEYDAMRHKSTEK